jgi:uncharacterized protein
MVRGIGGIMRITIPAILVCASLLLAARASADEASHRAAVVEFFKLAEMDKLMDETMDGMMQAQLQMNPSMAPLQDTFRKFIAKYMSWKALEPEFVAIYLQNFTEIEMKELITFYKTPTGRKALKLMPKLMQQGAQVGARRVQEHMPELVREMQQQQQGKAPPAATQPAKSPAAPKPPAAKGTTK